MKVRPAGPVAVLFEVDGLAQAEELYAELAARHDRGELPGVLDIVPAARTVLVVGRTPAPVRALSRQLRSWAADKFERPAGTTHQIPVHYDGEDLTLVARQAGMSEHAVADLHCRTGYRVAFCGFSPGFAYLAELPPQLRMARRQTPRTSVPPGAVAVAGEFTAVYPRASPGGWQIIGHTDTSLWDPHRDPPALLAPGDQVRFTW